MCQVYPTVPQSHLGGRNLPYIVGHGLGGGSIVNFMLYTRGPSADYNRWAEMIGDSDWGWEKTRNRLNQVKLYVCLLILLTHVV